MPELIPPPWGDGWKPSPPPVSKPPGNPQWTKGVSGNPAGRPPGRPDKRLLATQSMLDEMRNIVAVLVGKALEGDTNAANIVLSKTLPSLKAHAALVEFDFDANATISEQVSAVLDGIARGQVPPDVGRVIIESIKALADVRATEDLAARIEALELKHA